MKKNILLLVNTITLIFMLAVNGLGGSGTYFGKSVGEVSNENDTLITPAGYAFSIWGAIFLGLIVYVIAQWVNRNTARANESLIPGGWWFAVSNLANGLWVFAWVHEQFVLSVILMLTLLFSLTQLVIKLRLEIWDAPMRVMLTVWWPLTFYFGWIISATVVNIAAVLKISGWDGFGIAENVWSMVMIGAATSIYVYLVVVRCLRESATIGIWAFVAIAYKFWEVEPSVAYAAIVGIGILFITTNLHAYKHRATLPGIRKTPPEYK
ncbi:hypothetical protein [Phaeocystidibacter luteus]|uniref:Tryptophan-rich sensory protein n=1 Tax=Phaeocystidibacter luteus TaxID=911197 RepID=A0A6N6RK06_9FLAO|nr:hypothetical protein [Phaeocystidibacter luteus]KAB2808611.1 hypothetical protein F8C67_10005 [Phaeocystidibacter luteus]